MVFGLLGSLAARPTGDPADLPSWSCGFDSRRPLPCSGPGRAHGRGTSPEPEPGRGPHTGHMSRIACVLGLTLAGLAGQAAECFGDHLITITGGVLVDYGRAGAGVPEPGHQFLEGRARGGGERSPGVPEVGLIVEVQAGTPAATHALPQISGSWTGAVMRLWGRRRPGRAGRVRRTGRDASAIRIRDRRGTRPCAVRHEISGCETSRRIRCRSTPPTPANGHRSATLEAEQPPAVHPMAGGGQTGWAYAAGDLADSPGRALRVVNRTIHDMITSGGPGRPGTAR